MLIYRNVLPCAIALVAGRDRTVVTDVIGVADATGGIGSNGRDV